MFQDLHRHRVRSEGRAHRSLDFRFLKFLQAPQGLSDLKPKGNTPPSPQVVAYSVPAPRAYRRLHKSAGLAVVPGGTRPPCLSSSGNMDGLLGPGLAAITCNSEFAYKYLISLYTG